MGMSSMRSMRSRSPERRRSRWPGPDPAGRDRKPAAGDVVQCSGAGALDRLGVGGHSEGC
jgi:hypothetical protein